MSTDRKRELRETEAADVPQLTQWKTDLIKED